MIFRYGRRAGATIVASALVFLLTTLSWAHTQVPHGAPGAVDREGQMAAADAFLRQGQTDAAERAFDRIASAEHAPDVELSLVRTYMQAGAYRRALAFGAHAAGAHKELAAGTALYAWLLHIGGQDRAAKALIEAALARAPGDAVLLSARTQLSGAWPRASGDLIQGPWRTAPHAWGAAIAAPARVVGSGVLLDDGRSALVPTRVIDGPRRIWLRNGVGQTSPAEVDHQLPSLPLTLLRLSGPLILPQPVPYATREPFAGSPAFTLEYAPGDGSQAAWPLLRLGYFARVPRQGLRELGISAPPGPRGGPVLAAEGSVAGIAIVDDEGHDRLLPLAALPAGVLAAGDNAPRTARRLQPDEIYELGLRITLQVITAH